MIIIAKNHIEENGIKLVHKETKVEFKTFDDLEYDKDGSEIINQIANAVLQGVQMGKPLAQK